MSINVDALLVFCEGPHDAAYVRVVLKKVMGFSVKKLKFSEMPSPFDKLFETAVKTHAAQDMSMDMAHKFFLPDTVLRRDKHIVFLFNCGGKTQYKKVRTLLSSYIPMFGQAETFSQGSRGVTQSVRYLFLYDADADGLEVVIDNLNREFRTIEDEEFIKDDWQNSKSDHGKISSDKAVFVWGGKPEQGTLEDILVPLFDFEASNKELMSKAKKIIGEMFTWEIDHDELVRVVAETEKYQKAVLTTVGQRKKPGCSLNVILEQSKLITQEALQSSDITTGFVEFVNDFLEIDTKEFKHKTNDKTTASG